MCFRLDSAGSGLWALLRPNQPASSQPLCPLFSVFDFQGQCAPADSRRLGSRQGLLGIAEKKMQHATQKPGTRPSSAAPRLCTDLDPLNPQTTLRLLELANRAVFGWGEAVHFFWSGKRLGSASAASTKIPLLRARFQRAIGLGRGVSRSAPPGAICVLPSGTAGSG
jgi:hypothetical protein